MSPRDVEGDRVVPERFAIKHFCREVGSTIYCSREECAYCEGKV